MATCPLCNNNSPRKVQDIHTILFITCAICGTLYKHPQHHLDSPTEKSRYLAHQNDVGDLQFQKFVSPIVDAVTSNFLPQDTGLDFGAGTGPVIYKLLYDKGYHNIELYDPFFHPSTSVLQSTYDFIICCEVIEHFYEPSKEFELLYSLLRPNGNLFCMTGLIPKDIELKDWWYLRDTTHVVFYSEENLQWIKENFGFNKLKIDGSLVAFEK
jgi:SAM-dependent methyltransferase